MFEGVIARLGAVEVEALQFFPVFDGCDAFVGDVFGEVEVEVCDVGEVPDFGHALIGDVGEGQVEGGDIGKVVEMAKVGVGGPGASQADRGDAVLCVAGCVTAEVFDPSGIGCDGGGYADQRD